MGQFMDFIIIGGGCYGSFYTRQLLRGADRIGIGKIHVVDRDSGCQVVRELGGDERDPGHRLVFHFQDWKLFLENYLVELLDRHAAGEEIQDQYAPPCLAPHILFELFLEKAKKDDPTLLFSQKPVEFAVGTPLDMKLPSGNRALSFATWTCPRSCIEPPTCPHTKGPKDWDMKEYLAGSIHEWPLRVDSLHLFQCLHYAMGVGTIPMKSVVEEYIRFRDVVRVPGTHLSAMATVSSCHGLLSLVESSHD